MSLSPNLPWELANRRWASEINPVLALPILGGNIISNIVLAATTPLAVNHLLGQMPQGWFLIDINADAVIWRTIPWTNTTITLEANNPVTVSMYIF